MIKAKKAWRCWFWVLLLTAVTGVAGIPGIVFSAIHRQHFLMALCIVLVVHAFYGIAFYAMAMANAGHAVRIAHVVEQYGVCTLEELASAASLPLRAAKDSVQRCVQKGYLEGYRLTDCGIERIADRRPEPPEPDRFCTWCGRRLQKGETVCPGCGAPAEESSR